MIPCARPQLVIDYPTADDSSFTSSKQSIDGDGSLKLSTTRQKFSQPLRKSVKFGAYDEVIEIPHIKDMSVQEKADIWLSEGELKNIRQECSHIIKSLELYESEISELQETESMIIRGLECFTERNLTQAKLKRASLYDIVDLVQELQREQGIILPEFLAYHCRHKTEDSRQNAEVYGLRDAFEVESFVPVL